MSSLCFVFYFTHHGSLSVLEHLETIGTSVPHFG
jgi:hypothetical protein